LIGKGVANPDFGEKIARMSAIWLYLAAQAIDIDLEHMAFAEIFCPPDMLQQQFLRHHPTGILREVGQDTVFCRRQGNFYSCHRDQALGAVDRQVADGLRPWNAVSGFLRRKLRAAQHRPHTSQEFLDAKV
jgi:hypothetical protein